MAARLRVRPDAALCLDLGVRQMDRSAVVWLTPADDRPACFWKSTRCKGFWAEVSDLTALLWLEQETAR